MAFTLIETVDADPNYILAQCAEDEPFKSGDYVWITNEQKQWVGQLVQPPIPVHRSNQEPSSPALLNLAQLMSQHPGILPDEINYIMRIGVRGEINDGDMGELETRWVGGARVKTMTADDVVKYLRIPVCVDRAICGTNAIGINTNAANTPFCLTEMMLDSHVMIAGATNSGKSNVLMNVVDQAQAYGDCVFLYDSKPDFRLIAQPNSDPAVIKMWDAFSHLKKVPRGFKDIYSIGFYGRCNKKRVQKVIGFWASSFEPDELASLFFPDRRDKNQFEAFEAAAAHLKEGIDEGKWPHYTVQNLLETVEQDRRAGKNSSGNTDTRTVDAIKSKVKRRHKSLFPWLDAVGEDLDPDAFGTGSGRVVEEFDYLKVVKPGRLIHISLEAIRRPTDHGIIVAYFLRKGFEYCQSDNAIGITQAIDEASRIFDNKSDAAAPLIAAFNTAVREGRSRNHSMVLSLQNASQLPEDVMQNLCTHIVMKQNNLQVAKCATQVMGDEYAHRAVRLARGRALVKMEDSLANLSVMMAPSPCELERINNKEKLR
jgi:hypothetical protein